MSELSQQSNEMIIQTLKAFNKPQQSLLLVAGTTQTLLA
ncbi:hypothetical protein AALB_2736 [Agarivorans albus MKT 106]|uniref:Uncharacterized protein n=1 Tax=Agarivorans albus MKT 106 TaxID=1331007 RepID=R9PTM0_AGAAL|nr:hypothetical protein AALB_2736 [Agarivorans albus MKT 106]